MKIFCVGRNYGEHAKELKNEIPEEPVIFMKPKNALLQPNTPFYYPEFSNELHYELEIILHVSKNGRYIPGKHADKYVNEISVGIDFTARDIQNELKKKGLPWEKAKAFDNSAVAGTWKPLKDGALEKPMQFYLLLNGEKVQHGNSADMVFDFKTVISHISQYFSLNIGDMIFTGTPAGVGECSVGDRLEGFFENEKLFDIEVK
ncbi:MAG: fumarylacetoacetate hydrolase family protein [Chitinophagaceae bacterium]|nr:fumarylacetoacetate hydrolase family protein [Chitinophagaceae bacterium]